MQSVKEVVSESVGTAWIPSWGMVSLISSCQNSSWWRLQRGEWIFELCLPPGLTLQSGISSLTWGLESMRWPLWLGWPHPRRMESSGPALAHSEALLCCSWWRQSCGCVQLKASAQKAQQTLSLCCAETLPDKNEPVFMLCHKWWMASGLLAKVCSGDHQLVQLALVVLISKGKLWNVSVAH